MYLSVTFIVFSPHFYLVHKVITIKDIKRKKIFHNLTILTNERFIVHLVFTCWQNLHR